MNARSAADGATAGTGAAPAPATVPLDAACPDGGGLRTQFRRPRGFGGRIAGLVMAVKNRSMGLAALDALDLPAGARVLEIGFGPGVVLEALVRRPEVARIAGIDPSELMLAWTGRRCRGDAARGRVDLRLGVAEALPWPDATFDRALAVNSFHLWSDPQAGLGELRRVLTTGGRVVLGLRVALPEARRLASPGLTDEQIARVPPLLVAAGFRDVYVERRSVGSREAAIVGAAC